MDRARFGRDLLTSVRLPVTGERWLILGALGALLAFGLWVTASWWVMVTVAGTPPSGLSLSLFTAVVFLWILGPAVLCTFLVGDSVLDEGGNLAQYYRVKYPSVLVVPPVVAFVLGVAVGIALGSFPPFLLGALAALGSYTLVRTLAYSFRVFSLSAPRAVQAFVLESAAVLAAALVVGLADVTGNRDVVVGTARGIDAALGTRGVTSLVTDTWSLGGASLPAIGALAAGFPVALALTYLLLQWLVGVSVRVREVTVPRSQLRTGQRYPSFARPETREPADMNTPVRPGSAGAGPASATDGRVAQQLGPEASGQDGATAGSATPEATDDSGTAESGTNAGEQSAPNHTRVYTPPEDTEFQWGPPDAATGDRTDDHATGARSRSTGNETTGSGYACPTCEETFSGETSFAYCPTCGTELQPSSDR